MFSYFKNIITSFSSLIQGLKLTIQHLKDANKKRKPMPIVEDNYFDFNQGIITQQYPKEKIPLPLIGRNKLHNEIEDCIVCDKCAKVCPVNCIEIEPIRAVDKFGVTSDGTPKRIYAAKFDIDMAKCCFCGLCTTVCPTECLTMTSDFEYSEFDVKKHNFPFSNMENTEIEAKKREFEEYQLQKSNDVAEKKEDLPKKVMPKPSFKPKIPTKK